jgi:hypothetical protein
MEGGSQPDDWIIRPPVMNSIFDHAITAVSIGIEVRKFGEINGTFPISVWGREPEGGPDAKIINLPVASLPVAAYEILLKLSMEVVLEDLVVIDQWKSNYNYQSTYSRAWFMSHSTILSYKDPIGAIQDAEQGHTTLAKAFGPAWTCDWASAHDELKRGAQVNQNLHDHTAIIGEMVSQNFVFGKTTDGSND